MPLILNNLPPLHWAVAGAGIATITLLAPGAGASGTFYNHLQRGFRPPPLVVGTGQS